MEEVSVGMKEEKVPKERGLDALRMEVRAFLANQRRAGTFEPICDSWLEGHDPAFSRRLGKRGWVGMTLPRRYGGHERSSSERFVVNEELLAGGAPVAAHWIADRQSAPMLLRFGTEEQRERFLPEIAAGSLYVSIGMSEPDSGSDLASVRTRATRTDGGWIVNGTKVWTSHAHRSHLLIALVRTSPRTKENRHVGLSQFIIELDADGVAVSPIEVITGGAHFAEVSLHDVFVPDAMVIGEVGDGWAQVTSELAYERGGPERFLSTYPLFAEALRNPPEAADVQFGDAAARLWTLHLLSQRVNQSIDEIDDPGTPALVKNAGTLFEKEIIEIVRAAYAGAEDMPTAVRRLFERAILAAPGFTLRGGTNEILRTVIARSWGV